MYFEITISTIKPGRVLEVKKQGSFGIEKLEELREKIKVKIDAEKVVNTVPALNDHIYNLKVSEKVAKESQRFKKTDTVKIQCSKGFLNRFVKMIPEIDKNETGEIEEVRFINKVDDEALLEAWKTEGYPVRWTAPSILSKILTKVAATLKCWQPSWLDTEQIS